MAWGSFLGKWDVAVIGLPWIRRPGEDLKVNMVAAATSIIAGWGAAMPTVDSSWPALSGASTGPPAALNAVLNGDLCPVAPCGTRYGKLGWWRPFWGRQAMTSAAGIGISASNMLRQFQVLLSIKFRRCSACIQRAGQPTGCPMALHIQCLDLDSLQIFASFEGFD